MKNLVVVLFVSVFCSASLALELDTEKFMPVDEVKPGMTGIGKTVFEGTKIEEFQIEVLDVVKNATGPRGDVIWVLCSGGPLEETGVLSGMSGSPVYIDGKLIGAVAYRLGNFPKRPVAGITPIANMLSAIERGEKATERAELGQWPSLESMLADDTPSASTSDGFRTVMPIQTPVMMSGFHPEVMNDLAPVMRKYGMVPVQGGGSSASSEPEEARLEPGAALGIQFIKGDMAAFASGTVTYVDEGKFLGFGHPFVNMGRIGLPVTGGRVGLLMSSMQASAKYTTPTEVLGTLAYDNESAVMGFIGKQPEFIPMKVRIDSQWSGHSQEYNFEIAKHRLFSPLYMRSAAASAIFNAEKLVGDYTMRTHWEIEVAGYPAISKDNVFSGASPGAVAASFAAPVYALMQNSFEEADIESVVLEISFEDRRTSARIDGVRISKDRVRPGDSLEVMVSLTPYMEDTVTTRFEIAVPEDMPEGRSLLRVSDAASSVSWEKARAPMKSRITDLPHLIRVIREEESNNDIIVEIFAAKPGVTIGDKELPALPLTVFSAMSSRKQMGDGGFTRGTTFVKQRVSTEYVVSGNMTLPLTIDWNAPH